MEQIKYDINDIDKDIREIIHSVHSRIDQIYYGIYDEMTEDEKKHFIHELKKLSDTMYDSINKIIMDKFSELNRINSIITNLNEELTKSMSSIKENINFKDFLYNTIVHDMKNPLLTIMGYIELILSGKSSDSYNIINFINNIKSSAQILQGMIMDLLDISKMEEKKLILEYKEVNLGDFVNETIDLFFINLKNKKIDIKKDIDNNIIINIDIDIFRRVILNILNNSYKFCPANNGVINISLKEENNFIFLKISNNGPPVPDDIKNKIFDKFYTNNFNSRYPKGTGLGLTFCKMVIEEMKGEIWVESPIIDNYGAMFIIKLNK